MKLHYSQTTLNTSARSRCFSTLWNYTTLKRLLSFYQGGRVSVPYEITLLSNMILLNLLITQVSVPYEITLLSNSLGLLSINNAVSVPYEITLLSNGMRNAWKRFTVSVPYEITLLSNLRHAECLKAIVSVPYEITLLSNIVPITATAAEFQYLMKLHYSQTKILPITATAGFSTLWNYTTLKPRSIRPLILLCFSTLWNYTTLKLKFIAPVILLCFSTLWNYTTLKRSAPHIDEKKSFSTLWNYTTLKQYKEYGKGYLVSVPYEITLLSNHCSCCNSDYVFQYLMKLHYSQTFSISYT